MDILSQIEVTKTLGTLYVFQCFWDEELRQKNEPYAEKEFLAVPYRLVLHNGLATVGEGLDPPST